MELISYLPIELRLKIFRKFVPLMTINKPLKREIKRKWFRTILPDVDHQVKYFRNELPAFMTRTAVVECNRLLVKDLGDSTKTIKHLRSSYALSFLIVTFQYYGCDDLLKELIHLIEEAPERCLTQIIEYLIEVSENSESIQSFVRDLKNRLLKRRVILAS